MPWDALRDALVALVAMPKTLFTFGSGPYGELGQARQDSCHQHPEAVAVPFPSAPQLNGEALVEAVALGTDHSLALVGGKVYRWGLYGAHAVPRSWRGHGRWASENEKNTPEVVPAPRLLADLRARSASPASPQGRRSPSPRRSGSRQRRGVAAITCGGSNSFVLSTEGEVLLFGGLWPPGGDTNQLRHLWGTAKGGPASKVSQVAAGWRHCLILTEAGRVFALGDDEFGQCAGSGSGAAALPLPSAQLAVGVAAGACHSFAWDSSGSAFAWGHGGNGRLGLGSAKHRSLPERVDALSAVCGVTCGANFSFFVTEAGRCLWACGGNSYGQLGIEATSALVPLPVPLPTSEVIAAIESGANHVICLTKPETSKAHRNSVWAWGNLSFGQCGRLEGVAENPESQRWPARLIDFSPPSPNFAVAVAAGRSHSAVLATKGPSLLTPPWSPSKTPTAPEKVSPEKAQQEDVIEEFLTCLVPTPAASRSKSPTASLVELGEAALLDGGPRSAPLRARRGQRLGGTHGLHGLRAAPKRPVGARRSMTPRTREPGRAAWQTPRQAAEFIEPVTLERQAPLAPGSPPRTKAPDAKKGLLAEAVLEDKWSGIHQSLEGLSSLIAQIGSPERAKRAGPTSPAARVAQGPATEASLRLGIWQGPASFHDFHDFHEKEPPAIRPLPEIVVEESKLTSRLREDSQSDVPLDFVPGEGEEAAAPYELTEEREGSEEGEEFASQRKVNAQEDRWNERLKLQEEQRLEEQKQQQEQRMRQLEQELQHRSQAVQQDSSVVERQREEERRRKEEESRREQQAILEQQAEAAREAAHVSRSEGGPQVQRFQEDEVESSSDEESPQASAEAESSPRLPVRGLQRMELTPGTDGRTMSSDVTVSRARHSLSSQDDVLATLGTPEESTEDEDDLIAA